MGLCVFWAEQIPFYLNVKINVDKIRKQTGNHASKALTCYFRVLQLKLKTLSLLISNKDKTPKKCTLQIHGNVCVCGGRTEMDYSWFLGK